MTQTNPHLDGPVRIFWYHRIHPNVQLRQILFNQNLSNISRPTVLRSFSDGFEFEQDVTYPSANTLLKTYL